MSKAGRKKIKIDWSKVDAMCKIQCTQVEICSILDICEDTINARCKEEHGINFSEYSAKKREGGKASLRRMQWQQAEKSPAMAIFLGKNILGQSDKQEIEHKADVNVNNNDLLKKMSDEDLELLQLTYSKYIKED